MKPRYAVVASLVCLLVAARAEQLVPTKKPAEVTVSRRAENAKPVKVAKPTINTTGRSIMRLDEDVEVCGRPCKKGWLKLHPNGVPLSFTAAREFDFGKLKIPVDTWVMQNETGQILVCALPGDMDIQGVPCRGTGGAKGVQVEVYPCGALKKAFLAHDAKIQGVPCAEGLISGAVEFYQDGSLKSCKLSEAYTYSGVAYKKGARLDLPATVQGERVASK